LRELDGTILLLGDVDPKEVLDVSFHSDVQLCILDLLNHGIKLPLAWTSEDGIVCVEYIDNIAFVEDTIIHFGLFESDLVDELVC
jgi:hypothetical protein